jgi:TRAP-type C4-dicarboxylate transport system substrate-binding protein
MLYVAAALFAQHAAAQTKIKFGHVDEPGLLFAQSADEFARKAHGRLGGYKELLQKLKLGMVDLACPLIPKHSVQRVRLFVF